MFPRVFFASGGLNEDSDPFNISDRVIRKILEASGEYSIAADLKIYPVHYLLYYLKLFSVKEQCDQEEIAFESLDSTYNFFKREEIEFEYLTVSN